MGKSRQKRFNRTKNQIQNAEDNNLHGKANRSSPVSLNESHRLIQSIEHGNITHKETLKRIASIRDDIKIIDDLGEYNSNQIKLLNALFMVDEIFTGERKWYKLTDNGYMLLRSKSDKKESDIAEQKSDEQLQTRLI